MKADDGSLRSWIKTLPLIVLAIVLLGFGSYEFIKLKEPVPAVAALTAGTLVLGIWVTMLVADWEKDKKDRSADEDEDVR